MNSVTQGKKMGLKHEMGTGCCNSGSEETTKNTRHQESDSAGEHHSTLQNAPTRGTKKIFPDIPGIHTCNYLLFGGFGLFVSGLAWF